MLLRRVGRSALVLVIGLVSLPAGGHPATAAADTTLLAVEGEAGERVVGGKFAINGVDPVVYSAARIETGIDEFYFTGAQFHDVLFRPLRDDQRNTPGLYENAVRADTKPKDVPGLYYFGNGLGCYTLTGRYRIDQADRDVNGNLVAFAARFEQHCAGEGPSAFGTVAYHATVPVYAHQLSAYTLAFPTTAAGDTSAPTTLTISNRSPQGLPVTSLLLGGADAGAFTISSDPCSGTTIALGGTCTVGVVYHPSVAKTTVSAHLTVNDAFTAWGGTAPVGEDVPFTIGATAGGGGGGAPGGGVLTTPATGGEFHPLPPARVLDTRDGTGVPGGAARVVGDHETVTVAVAGHGGVPATGATAVVVNLTATGPRQSGWLALFPSGTDWPGSSSLNFVAGDTVANLAVAALGADGALSLRNCCGTTDAVLDVVGWYGTPTDPPALGFYPLAPRRLLDTRLTNTPLGPDEVRMLPTRTPLGAPANASAVVVNVTATDGTADTYLTVYPSDAVRATSSSLNVVRGETRPNLVTAKLGADGSLAIYNHTGRTDVVVDIVGYYGPSRVSSGRISTSAPRRVLDTRNGIGKVPAGGTTTIDFRGDDGVAHVEAVILNVTVTGATAASFVTAYPSGGALPDASNLNVVAGQTIANLVVVPLGADGKVAFFNHAGAADLVVDLVGVVPL